MGQSSKQANSTQVNESSTVTHPDILRFAIWDHANIVEVETSQMIMLGRSVGGDSVSVDLEPFHGRLLGVSRRHALIFPTPSGLAIRDLNSANGTCLNGTPLQSGKAYALQHGDELQLGGLYLTLYFGKAD